MKLYGSEQCFSILLEWHPSQEHRASQNPRQITKLMDAHCTGQKYIPVYTKLTIHKQRNTKLITIVSWQQVTVNSRYEIHIKCIKQDTMARSKVAVHTASTSVKQCYF